MTLSVFSDIIVATAGDNYLFNERVPASETWEILNITAMNATTVCVLRVEVLTPDGRVIVLKTHHQGRVTNFDPLSFTGRFPLPGGWRIRVLASYCQASDSVAGEMIVQRSLIRHD